MYIYIYATSAFVFYDFYSKFSKQLPFSFILLLCHSRGFIKKKDNTSLGASDVFDSDMETHLNM